MLSVIVKMVENANFSQNRKLNDSRKGQKLLKNSKNGCFRGFWPFWRFKTPKTPKNPPKTGFAYTYFLGDPISDPPENQKPQLMSFFIRFGEQIFLVFCQGNLIFGGYVKSGIRENRCTQSRFLGVLNLQNGQNPGKRLFLGLFSRERGPGAQAMMTGPGTERERGGAGAMTRGGTPSDTPKS